MASDERIKQLQREVAALRKAFYCALAWMAQSANTPLSHAEVKDLIAMADQGLP